MKVLNWTLLIVIMSVAVVSAQTAPLSLQECIEIALSKNPNLVRAMNDNESADEEVLSSYSGILPAINLSASSGRAEAGPREVEGDVPIGIDPETGDVLYERRIITQEGYITDFNNFGVSVNQNLFDGGEWWKAIEYAKSQKRASDYDLEAITNTTVRNVQESFFNVLKQQKLFEVYTLAVQRSQDNLDKTQKMFELGAVAKVDVFRARVELGNDRINLLLQESAITTAKQNLNLVMGRDPESPIEVAHQFDLPSGYPSIDDLVSQALAQNPDLKAAEEDLNSMDIMVSRSWAYVWPSLGIFYNYNRSNQGIERVYSGWDKNWNQNWGLSLRLNIFNGFNDKVRIQQSKLAFRNARESYEEIKRNLRSSVSILAEQYNYYLEIIDINEANLEAAQEEFRLAEERYRIGSGTALEVTTARENLTRAEEVLVGAKYNARMTLADIEQKLGIIYKDKGMEE